MKAGTKKLSLTEFKRGGTVLLKKLRKSGRPVVLTLNGVDAFILQSAEQYEREAEEWERAQAIEGIRRGLESMESGGNVSAVEAFVALEEKYPYLRRS
jgi:PHD/YefM family antitoxin component YafN of YafNO toxin-antitoxin module